MIIAPFASGANTLNANLLIFIPPQESLVGSILIVFDFDHEIVELPQQGNINPCKEEISKALSQLLHLSPNRYVGKPILHLQMLSVYHFL